MTAARPTLAPARRSLLLAAGLRRVGPSARPDRGGKGGRIIRVTTLAKDGPGSLAEALAAKGPRIVVFEVGGAIDLARSTLDIREPYVTIAGQTAPSPGITLHPRRHRREHPRRDDQPLARPLGRRRPGAR